jgi:hypothetical protein
MQNTYSIIWLDAKEESFDENGHRTSESVDEGWYCKVSNYGPWGPFENQVDAMKSMLIEWERFEDNYWDFIRPKADGAK